jgi:polysaccharide export outer membrane protein
MTGSNELTLGQGRRWFVYLFHLLMLAPGVLFAQDTNPAVSPSLVNESYKLGPGDQLGISVLNQSDLSGDFTLDGSGRFSMHLIGQVEANDLTAMELEALLVSRLKPDFLVNPRVSVRVQSYRPYYLIGEVNSTGTFAYVDGMTYLTAIAIAGGYTYRAKKDFVYVVREDDIDREEIKLDIDEKVKPGDIIRIAERLF